MRKIKDLTGQTFTRLYVLNQGPYHPKGILWICWCACGNTCIAFGHELRRKHKKSCGCLHEEGKPIGSKTGYITSEGRLMVCSGSLKLKESLYQKQKGLCALCSCPLDINFRKSYLDHDHQLKRLRGLVHPVCNTVIGYFETHEALLKLVPDYQMRMQHGKKMDSENAYEEGGAPSPIGGSCWEENTEFKA